MENPSVSKSLTRSRSPIPRIKHMFSLRLQSAPPIHNLPGDLVVEIGRHISSRVDILSLSLVCKGARSALMSKLYSTVELKTNKHCTATLEAFSKQPEITQHIHTLIVRPNNLERTPSSELLDEALVSHLIIRMSSRLQALHTFAWDGMEMPVDDLWYSFRKFCPFLKSISTSVGSEPLRNDSHLYDFSNLIRFSINVKCVSFQWMTEGRPAIERLPRRLWAMLLERCSTLEELTIGGRAPSPRPFNIRHLTAGRWPRLRSLTLGDMVIQFGKDEKALLEESEAFMRFLVAHPLLQTLAFQHAGGHGFPSSLSLPRSALPNIKSFSGPPIYIKSLPKPRALQELTISTLHHSTSSLPPICAILQGLPYLTSLSIWIDLSFTNRNSPHDDGSVFSMLLECCPRLHHFDVMCFTRPTFHVKEFSDALLRSPQLRSFSLTKIYKPNDEEMIQTANRIARNNPNIRTFHLRYSQDSWFTHGGGRAKQIGKYDVIAGPDGLPNSLLVYEWGARPFSQPYCRNYVQPLRTLKTRHSSKSYASWRSDMILPPKHPSCCTSQPSILS